MYYDCKVDASAAGVQGTITLTASVHALVTHKVPIHNPFKTAVHMKAQASDKQVRILPGRVLHTQPNRVSSPSLPCYFLIVALRTAQEQGQKHLRCITIKR